MSILLNRLKQQMYDDDVDGNLIHACIDRIEALEAHRQISEETLGSVSAFLKAGDNDKAREWLESGIKRIDDANL
jgi:hypothetical protein